MNLFTQLRQEWHAATPKHLLDAPVTVLKAVDEPRAATLRDVLGIRTVREMAAHPLADWVWRTFSLFRAGVQRELPPDATQHVSEEWRSRSCGEWLASPLSSLSELSAEDVQRLGDGLRWVTVRNLATDTAFEAAREIARIVTGEPKAPEDAVTRPLPDYFAGGTQRFLDKVAAAGGQPRKPPPPPPPPPPAPPAAAQRAPAAARPTPVLALEGETAPAVAAGLHPGGSVAWAGVTQHHGRHAKDYTADGTYIPHGGGSRGWLDNQGVARAERANRYRYEEVVDVARFKRTALEQAVKVNNRGADRQELRMQVRWGSDPAAPPKPGLCLNISLTGARLRLGQMMSEGTPLSVTWVHRDDLTGAEQGVLALTAQVVWCQAVNPNFRKPRYDCGVHFDPLSLDAQQRLTFLLTERLADLLQMGEPEPPQAEASA
jgi:PilZ domain